MKTHLIVLGLVTLAGAGLWAFRSGTREPLPSRRSKTEEAIRPGRSLESGASAARTASSARPADPVSGREKEEERTIQGALERRDLDKILEMLEEEFARPDMAAWLVHRLGDISQFLASLDPSAQPRLLRLLERTPSPILQEMLLPVVLSSGGPEAAKFLGRKLGSEQDPMRLSRYLGLAQACALQTPEIDRQAADLLKTSLDSVTRVAAAELVADSKDPGAERMLRQAVERERDPQARDYLQQLLVSRHPPAEGFLLKKAGEGALRSGDILLTVNGRRVTSLEQMARESGVGPGKSASGPLVMTLYREGRVTELNVTSEEAQPLLGRLAGEYVVPEDRR